MRYRTIAVVAVAITLSAAAAQSGTSQARAAIEPNVVAISQLENLNNMVRCEPGTYGGLWIDHATNTVYVSTAKVGLTAARWPRWSRAATGAASMKLVVVHATYDFPRLESCAARVMNDKGLRAAAKASHATPSKWYTDPITDKLVIGFTKVTAAERAEVRAKYGSTARGSPPSITVAPSAPNRTQRESSAPPSAAPTTKNRGYCGMPPWDSRSSH